jgi:hypothetical protein
MLRFGPRYSGLASWTKRQSRDPSVAFGILHPQFSELTRMDMAFLVILRPEVRFGWV